MPEPKRARAEAALDDVSDHLGVVLQRADELLVQWSAFGATVRGQVEREAAAIGDAVAGAVDAAVARATATGVDRAITEQVGARLTALTAEITKLEARTRAAARAVADERMGDRRLLWIVIGGVVLANALLVAILLRRPAVVPAPAEPAKVELVSPPGASLAPAPAESSGSAGEPEADAPSSNALPSPAKENATRPEPHGAALRAHPAGAPAAGVTPALDAKVESSTPAQAQGGARTAPSAKVESSTPAQAQAGSAAGARTTPAAKLPPRTAPPKK
jgi:hypothetical protein